MVRLPSKPVKIKGAARKQLARGMPLIKPSLRERLAIVAQEHPDFDRVRSGSGEIELHAPMTRYVIGHRLHHHQRKCPPG